MARGAPYGLFHYLSKQLCTAGLMRWSAELRPKKDAALQRPLASRFQGGDACHVLYLAIQLYTWWLSYDQKKRLQTAVPDADCCA